MSQVMDRAIDQVLEIAEREKLEMEVLGFERTTTAISFQKRKMDQFSLSELRQLGVRLIDGKHEGVAYTESLESDSLQQMVDEARFNARVIEREWIADLSSTRTMPELKGMYNEALNDVELERKIKAAELLESAAVDFDKRITGVAYSSYGDSHRQQWIANTKGLRGQFAANSCSAYAFCLAKDGEANVMDGEYTVRRSFEEIGTEALAKVAAERTLGRIGSVRPKTGRYTVVFEGTVAEGLVGWIADYFSAKAVDEKSSPLAGKLGQKIFSNEFHLVDDPLNLQAWGSRPFDSEGYASQKTTLIEGGVLKSYLTNSVLARKMNLPHTASAARAPSTELDVSASNLFVKPGTTSLDGLLNASGTVIFITRILGQAGFRATSGDFSVPVEGYLYENGKRTTPLKDFLIAGNILQLFASIEAVGKDALPPRGNIICPPLLVHDLNISGQA